MGTDGRTLASRWRLTTWQTAERQARHQGKTLSEPEISTSDASWSSSAARPGWVRDVPVPRALDELKGPLRGSVSLPARLFWSGPDPRAVCWNLANPARRRDLYEIVLVEGGLDDIRELVNPIELTRLWEQMYLPPWVRTAWQPLIDAARRAA